ncbi:MAG: GH32 C-terminal domain-containing protein, partial [Muribaculaceae bacterium]|nr:GH32 C-terminal domain-containing protein [Muribaculaceae bacterium]
VLTKARNISVGKKAREFALPATNGGVCEILLDIDCKKADSLDLVISNKAGERVVMKYNASGKTFSFDRRTSGIVNFSQDFPAVTVAPTFNTDNKLSLRIFIDKSSMEVFGNGGKFAMTNLVFPNEPYSQISVSAFGGKATIDNLKIFPIKEL